MDEIIFETYGFSRALVTYAPLMATYDPQSIVAGAHALRFRSRRSELRETGCGRLPSSLCAQSGAAHGAAAELPLQHHRAGSQAARARAAVVLDAGFSYTCVHRSGFLFCL